MSVKVLSSGAFRTFPEMFKTRNSMVIIEDDLGQRYISELKSWYTSGHAVVGEIPQNSFFLKLAENLFLNQDFVLVELVRECSGHVWNFDGGTNFYICLECGSIMEP